MTRPAGARGETRCCWTGCRRRVYEYVEVQDGDGVSIPTSYAGYCREHFGEEIADPDEMPRAASERRSAVPLSSKTTQQTRTAKQGHEKPSQTEKDFQAQVIALAKLYGWLAYHTHDSRKSVAGWPDLALCRPPRLVLAECKTDTGTVGYYQRQWLTALEACPGVEVFVWRPAAWPEITRILA